MMDGGPELRQLADLLRLGAQTGRQIATIRPDDASEIERLAEQAEAIATALDDIVSRVGALAGRYARRH